ncbi:SH3 domain-binding protein 5-like [Acanthaster planci]|uniref:SH3 domain-binding protein 5-like n=1 Tax=Acanthaster planci TaxID=133434 RepID=A0A8B7XYF7_ACAPL|nr:SH3 domain-binding protein 5-like [Acanthaster planci]
MEEPDQGGTRLDPRIKGELDKLNSTSEEINRLEKELDDARQQFRITLTESSHKLNDAAKRCGKSVKKAKPYHEARLKAKRAHEKVQEAAYAYQRAVGMVRAAKETITIAEETSMQGNKKREFDSALQEMLNHATVKLNMAEQEKVGGQKEHQQLSKAYVKSLAKVEQLAKKLRKSIAKSAAYYDLRDAFYSRLENLKESVENRQKLLAKCKKRYREALRNLERISEDIHHSRQLQIEASPSLQERSAGVGAESETEPGRNSDEEDDLFTSTEGGQDEHGDQEQNVPVRGAEGGAGTSRHSSSHSSSPEDGDPQSPLLTEHGLPTLSRKIQREGSDPDFYKPKSAIAKLPGILPEEQEVIEATYRGYRSFDSELTQEEVTALQQTLPSQARGSGTPVIMIDSPEGVTGELEDEGSDEDELEIYEPEEIEMSEFANEGSIGSDVGEGENSVEMKAFEQETQLNGEVDQTSLSESSEGDRDMEEILSKANLLQDAAGNSELSKPEVSLSDDSQLEGVEDGREGSVEARPRSMSFGFEKTLLDEDHFEKPDLLPSPIQKFQMSDLDRPSSPALFQYRALEHKQDVRQADDNSAFTYTPVVSNDDAATTNNNQDAKNDETD